MRCAILASGQSMTQAVADSVRDYPLVIAVSNVGIDTTAVDGRFFPALAPWAHALVAQDRRWWREYPDASRFAGRRFSANKIDGGFVERVSSDILVTSQTSSGGLALIVAERVFKATQIELFGFDMHGTHYFGPHREPMGNTTVPRFGTFQDQFAVIAKHLQAAKIRVVNKTPGSALRAFPFE